MERRQLLLGAVFAAIAQGARAERDQLWSALQAGGIAVLLRHAQTEPGTGDPPGFRLGDCATQRNLSEEGRRQSARIGEALVARGVRVQQVLSSEWCRCLDTARLVFPRVGVERFAALNSFFDDRSTEPAQTREALARILAIEPPANVVFVTHHVNIAALTGIAVGAGEAVLVRPSRGKLQVVGRLAL